ncbi:MAG: DeoR/GlpR family DNA-binding transcription regulator [Planctomycetota bacterium]
MVKASSVPLASKRRLEILDQLEGQGSVRVTALAELFEVAEETIRRDLDKLSDEGQLTRTHGGAIRQRSDRFDLPLAVRKNSRAAEKRAIAQLAFQHIEPGDVVAFDASTTVLELVCLLPDMPITVVTYGLDVVRLLAERRQMHVICTGGELDSPSLCLLGPLAEASFKSFSINKAFFSVKGIDLIRGHSEASTAHAAMKRLLVEVADQSFLLADYSKFGVRSLTYSGSMDELDVLITDDRTDESHLASLREIGIAVEVAESRTRSVEE